MKFIVALDSFKGSMSSYQAGKIVEKEILRSFPTSEVKLFPLGDGGEGTLDALIRLRKVNRKNCKVFDPKGNEINSYYGVMDDALYLESSLVIGLPLMKDKLDPLNASTYGLGLLLKEIGNKYSKIYLGLGGSATSDGGAGALAALGLEFYDSKHRKFIPTGKTLNKIKEIKTTNLINLPPIILLSDVNNPFDGFNGAAYIYSPQKGASPKEVEYLDQGLKNLASFFPQKIRTLKGAGAAGGLAGGIMAFYPGTKIVSGIQEVLRLSSFTEELTDTDYLFTGEGLLDKSSLNGKLIQGILKENKGKAKVIAIVGGVKDKEIEKLYSQGLTAVFTINRLPLAYRDSKKDAKENLKHTIKDILRLISQI